MCKAASKPPLLPDGIGPRLRLARTAAGFSRPELSASIGKLATVSEIGKYEQNDAMPNSNVLSALSAALGVSLDYLLGDQNIFLESIEFRKKKHNEEA